MIPTAGGTGPASNSRGATGGGAFFLTCFTREEIASNGFNLAMPKSTNFTASASVPARSLTAGPTFQNEFYGDRSLHQLLPPQIDRAGAAAGNHRENLVPATNCGADIFIEHTHLKRRATTLAVPCFPGKRRSALIADHNFHDLRRSLLGRQFSRALDAP